jgi:hypothetical protein
LGKRIAIADRPLLETFTIETNFNPEKTLT